MNTPVPKVLAESNRAVMAVSWLIILTYLHRHPQLQRPGVTEGLKTPPPWARGDR